MLKCHVGLPCPDFSAGSGGLQELTGQWPHPGFPGSQCGSPVLAEETRDLEMKIKMLPTGLILICISKSFVS